MENTTLYATTLAMVNDSFSNFTLGIGENTSYDYEHDHDEDYHEDFEDGVCCSLVIPQNVYIIVLNIILALGLLGNLLIFLAATDNFISTFSYSVYLKALAVSDSLVLITTCTEDNLDYHNKLDKLHLASEGVCKTWTGLSSTVTILSPWLVTLLTLDRYIGVAFPKKRAGYCTLRTAALAVTICIGAVLITRIPEVILTSVTDFDDHLECIPDVENKAYVIYQYITTLGLSSSIPCFLILGFNLHFVCIIQRYAGSKDHVSPDGGTYSGRVDRTTCSLMLVSIMAFLTLVPKTMLEVIEFAWTLQYEKEVKTGEEAGLEPPSYPGYLELANNTWPVLNLIYLLNFGQNFYVMLVTNLGFRDLLKKKLLFCPSSPGATRDDKTDNDPVTSVAFSTITEL